MLILYLIVKEIALYQDLPTLFAIKINYQLPSRILHTAIEAELKTKKKQSKCNYSKQNQTP